MRTRAEWTSASTQYQKLENEIEILRESNATLDVEINRLHSDPRAIESAARKRLNMVMPNEVVVPTDDLLGIDEQAIDAKSQSSKYSALNNRWLSYLELVFYCGIAVFGSFIGVKSFIAILRYLALKKGWLQSNPPLSPTLYVIKDKQVLSTLPHLSLLFLCGLVLAGGFIFAAGQHFNAVAMGAKSEYLQRDRMILIDQQRRLLLEREELTSPIRLEVEARKLGLKSVTPNMIYHMKQSETVSVKNSSEGIPASVSTEPFPNDKVNVIPPQTLKIILIILALLGGTLAILFSLPTLSELMGRGRLQGIRFERAPGSRYLSLVEFFYSPKAVEEIFKPIIADWRTEYCEALKQRREWKARWISIRYHYRFVQVIGLSKVFSLIKIFKSASK